MFDGKTILITGGTGSLGQALTKNYLIPMLILFESSVEMKVNKLIWNQRLRINVYDFL
jgi:FlaA1/EpsC-like NDP-sugar epimerase